MNIFKKIIKMCKDAKEEEAKYKASLKPLYEIKGDDAIIVKELWDIMINNYSEIAKMKFWEKIYNILENNKININNIDLKINHTLFSVEIWDIETWNIAQDYW